MVSTVRVTVPRDNFAERAYAVSVLFVEILGVDADVVAGDVEHYEICVDGVKRMLVRDHFFGRFPQDRSYLSRSALPTDIANCDAPWSPEPLLPILFGSGDYSQADGVLTCDADFFASAFFLVTRWEEFVLPERDEHGRVPSRCQSTVVHGFHHRPVVNEYAEALKTMLEMVGGRLVGRPRKFELVMTHDVDRVYAGSRGRAFLHGKPFVNAKRALISAYYTVTRIDPLLSFRRIMQECEERNLQARFYFIAGGSTDKEAYYDLSDPGIRALLAEIHDRGHIVGLHPSYEAATDPVLWQTEKQRLEDVIRRPCLEGRQHYLRWENPSTWRIWEKNGMRIDSTMGFADTLGYRCGTGDSFPVFDILASETMALREQPLVVMDSAMRFMSRSERRERLRHLVDVSHHYRMPLTVLFHNHSLDATVWKWAEASYSALFDDAFAGTM